MSYINHGPFTSYAPTYDSSFANVGKEDSDLIYCFYGEDASLHVSERYVPPQPLAPPPASRPAPSPSLQPLPSLFTSPCLILWSLPQPQQMRGSAIYSSNLFIQKK